jgi:hypothetical protein
MAVLAVSHSYRGDGIVTRDLFLFHWPVFAGRYRWIDAVPYVDEEGAVFIGDEAPRRRRGETARILVYPDDDPGARVYMPLRSEPALFLEFAAVPTTEEGVLAFAERYGALGFPDWALFKAGGTEVGLRDAGFSFTKFDQLRGEPLEYWASHIRAMRTAVVLWDFVRRGDMSGLRHIVRWVRDASGARRAYFRAEPDGGADDDSSLLYTVAAGGESRYDRHDGAYQLAIDYIVHNINTRLCQQVGPAVEWEEESRRLPMYFIPSSLVGALWLQFARAVDGGAEYRPCKGCGRLFEVSRSASRSDKQFCSNACRSKAYRERQEEARRLAAAGKSVKEIAKALDADPEAVKGWVSSGKGTKGKE